MFGQKTLQLLSGGEWGKGGRKADAEAEDTLLLWVTKASGDTQCYFVESEKDVYRIAARIVAYRIERKWYEDIEEPIDQEAEDERALLERVRTDSDPSLPWRFLVLRAKSHEAESVGIIDLDAELDTLLT